ncbi:MAG: NADH-quinone oxidoreductase subunit NuoE [Deltaproteobacteria bacterium]|nr:NADH-quinone oxidoreductase subunit NuoE [Deltaproteobacteria bacterium]
MSEIKQIENILENYKDSGREMLIPVLQEVQEEIGYLSKDAVIIIGKSLKLPTSKIYGVATFYNQFRFQKQGACHLQICRGTACHVKGSANILESFERNLNIKAGETTKDGKFSIEVVACIGACGLAPVIAANGEFHARLKEDNVNGIIDSYKSDEPTEKKVKQ